MTATRVTILGFPRANSFSCQSFIAGLKRAVAIAGVLGELVDVPAHSPSREAAVTGAFPGDKLHLRTVPDSWRHLASTRSVFARRSWSSANRLAESGFTTITCVRGSESSNKTRSRW